MKKFMKLINSVNVEENWKDIEFSEISSGDIFIVLNDENNIEYNNILFKAISNPYLNEKSQKYELSYCHYLRK